MINPIRNSFIRSERSYFRRAQICPWFLENLTVRLQDFFPLFKSDFAPTTMLSVQVHSLQYKSTVFFSLFFSKPTFLSFLQFFTFLNNLFVKRKLILETIFIKDQLNWENFLNFAQLYLVVLWSFLFVSPQICVHLRSFT